MQRIFLSSKEYYVLPVSYTTYSGVFAPGIKQPERDVVHTTSAVDVKNVGSYISIYIYVFVAWRLMEQRNI